MSGFEPAAGEAGVGSEKAVASGTQKGIGEPKFAAAGGRRHGFAEFSEQAQASAIIVKLYPHSCF